MMRIDAKLVVDTDYLPALLTLIESAHVSIDVLAYSFSIGSPKKRETSAPLAVARKLIDARKRGVAVRVFFEGRRETASRNRPTALLLRDGGVDVMLGSTHAKGVCVDSTITLFGSTNLSQQSLTKNIETNLWSDDDAVADGFERYFGHLWHGGHHGGITLPAPMLADGAFEGALIEMIESASARIDFSIYFFHHAGLQNALIRARRRGVDVTGLIHTHASFALSFVRRTQGTVQRLRAGGVDDLYYGPAHLFTHSKLLVRDRREIWMGTGNWLHEDIKIHPQLSVRFDNPALGRELVQHLASTIERQGTRVGDLAHAQAARG